MTENLQYRLYNAGIDPPVDAWPKIAEQMDKSAQEQLSRKLLDAQLTPPAHAWQHIAATLDESQTPVVPITRRWRKLAVAAIAVGIILLAGILYLRPDEAATASVDTGSDTSQRTPVPADTDGTVEDYAVSEPTVNRQTAARRTTPVRILAFAGMSGGGTRVRYAHLNNAETSQSFAADNARIDQQVAEYASMQPDAYVSPKDYLTVAAPNGQPARISTKFTNAVNFVFNNQPAEDIEMAIMSFSWKQRFRSWGNKLMANPAFIPAATNFLDIMALEELLKD